jgi:ribosome-associated toxin RatA of RatAB toxin-antitoxin module
MSQVHVEVSRIIDATPQTLHNVVADYKVGHPAILPRPYFQDLIVEKGGYGTGSVLEVHMKVFGIKRSFRQSVTEPEPGRVIMESNIGDDLVTTFTFEPLQNGTQTKVTISTDFTPKNVMDRLINPPVMRHIYRIELENLADYVRSTSTYAPASN